MHQASQSDADENISCDQTSNCFVHKIFPKLICISYNNKNAEESMKFEYIGSIDLDRLTNTTRFSFVICLKVTAPVLLEEK